MKYRLLVFDHDDTAVNSTATIHHPCFVRFLEEYYPGRSCSLEEYFLKNFSPGFLAMCREEYGMDDKTLEKETAFWREYVSSRVPKAYPGFREILLCRKRLICRSSLQRSRSLVPERFSICLMIWMCGKRRQKSLI